METLAYIAPQLKVAHATPQPQAHAFAPRALNALALAAAGLLVAAVAGASEVATTVETSLAVLLLVAVWDQLRGPAEALLTGPLSRRGLVSLSLGALAAYLASVAADLALGQPAAAAPLALAAGATLVALFATCRVAAGAGSPRGASPIHGESPAQARRRPRSLCSLTPIPSRR